MKNFFFFTRNPSHPLFYQKKTWQLCWEESIFETTTHKQIWATWGLPSFLVHNFYFSVAFCLFVNCDVGKKKKRNIMHAIPPSLRFLEKGLKIVQPCAYESWQVVKNVFKKFFESFYKRIFLRNFRTILWRKWKSWKVKLMALHGVISWLTFLMLVKNWKVDYYENFIKLTYFH